VKTLIALAMVLVGTLAVGQSTAAVKTWDPNNIVWQNSYPDGTKWSVLEGDKDAAGKAFTYAFTFPPDIGSTTPTIKMPVLPSSRAH
jgi:hypothetical protein